MFDANPKPSPSNPVLVVGAGIGGLCTALRLQAEGHQVTLLDVHDWVGGKMRSAPSDAGPVDAGPTVLTMRHVFDALFQASGSRLEDHVTLIEEPHIARHFWRDGSRLDLFSDQDRSADAIATFAGKDAAKAFRGFSKDAREIFQMFDAPMMQAAEPHLGPLAAAALSAPRHLAALSPFATLAGSLQRRFHDRRLVQLFGRYATYVGGSPYQSPALLSLIWQAEVAGVWRVEGGMHRLAKAIADRFQALGGAVRLCTPVAQINISNGGVTGVTLNDGEQLIAKLVVFNGDPRALAGGRLGSDVTHIAPQTLTKPRSLSARVWSFAAQTRENPGLAHHNVFFAGDPRAEFDDLKAGYIPGDPTLYVCAEDRGSGQSRPVGTERFEIILNAAPLTTGKTDPKETETCRQVTFPTLARFGLCFASDPPDTALSTPTTFNQMFPASAGSLYGQTPHGMTAALKRPKARTAVRGLYLAGGGTHPGAGVPMAALSGRHAAEAIMTDLVST